MSLRARLSAQQYAHGIRAADRNLLAQAITLVESTLDEDRLLAQELLTLLMPHTGGSLRLGITGAPGVGKSSLIEAFGLQLCQAGKRLAVLAVDPSSQRTGGSILGDKTRMQALTQAPNAFIRPSPAGHSLGGVNHATRESILLCEAAGYDVVLVETVGVGQSETLVRSMVDCFVLLLQTGAGDELQGIKRGIMEMADVLVVTKADGDNLPRTSLTQAEYKQALHLLPAAASGQPVQVLTCSAHTGNGLAQLWQTLESYQQATQTNGYWQTQRNAQRLAWYSEALHEQLTARLLQTPALLKLHQALQHAVAQGQLPPLAAVQQLLQKAMTGLAN